MTIKLCIALISATLLCIPVTSISLPSNTHPLHYDLKLDIDVEGAKFSGSVAIQVNVTGANVNLIALYSHEVQVDNVLIYKADNASSNLFSHKNELIDDQIIEFYTRERMNISADYVIQIEFQGAIRSDLKGLYMSSYWINGTRRNMATTFFAPIYARMVFPCYDSPSRKATFDVQITNSIKYHALSNAAATSFVQNTENITTTFQRTPKMPIYLLAFIVSDLVPTRNDSIAVWSQSSKKTATQYSLEIARQVMNVSEDYMGLPYQMSKLDLVAVDDFLMGAMENWGLITFASARLLADEHTTSEERQNIVKIISHEIVHQWFGNLVTCRFWTWIWLNEGFATYLEDVIADQVANEWLLLDQFVIKEKIPVMRKDSDRTNRKAMHTTVSGTEMIYNIYDFVAYPKAGSVLRMFHHVVGDRIFQETIREYLRVYQYDIVDANDFFAVLEAKATQLNFENPQRISLSQAFSNWAENYGFPVVTVNRDYERNMLAITQKRFIHSHFNSGTPEVDFYVPLKLAHNRSQNVDESLGIKWLTPGNPSMELTFADDSWVILNPNAFGYYRVNYDEANWNKLANALHATNSIPISSRVQLIDDSMVFARFGSISYSVALNLIRYIKSEHNYTPVSIALSQLGDLEKNLRGFDVNITGLFNDILGSLHKDYTSLSTHLDKLMEAEVRNFACQYGYEKCIKDSHLLFDSYLNSATIDPNLRKSMFCGSLQTSGENEERFKEVFNIWSKLASSEYERGENERHLNDVLASFSCIKNETYMEELLRHSLLSEEVLGLFMTTSDRNKIFSSIVSGSSIGTDAGLKFMRSNWDTAIGRYGSAVQVFNSLAPNVVTPTQVAVFNEIVFNNMRKESLKILEPRTYEAAMAAVRQVEENVQFISNNADQLKEWFSENYPGSSAKLHLASTVILLVGALFVLLF